MRPVPSHQRRQTSRKKCVNFSSLLPTSLAVMISMSALSLFYLRPIWRWSDGVLGGFPDTWMNVFQIWWMHKAFSEGTNPFFTPYLHHPTGAELYWHTLAPVKNGLGIFLLPFFDPVTAYNIIVFLTFVLSGYTSWLLFRFLCRDALHDATWKADLAAFAGAVAFNFSPYHLAHAWAHMNLIAIEGIPLFLLFYFLFKKRGASRYAIVAGFAALYVMLSDYYYFYYLGLFLLFDCVITSMRHGRVLSLTRFSNDTVITALKILGVMLVATSPLLFALLSRYFTQDIHNFQHGDSDYFVDLAGIFLPHRSSYWLAYAPGIVRDTVNTLPGNMEENGYFLGWFTVIFALIAVWKRLPYARFFALLAVSFGILSLGARLSVAGETVHRFWLLSLMVIPFALLLFARKRWLSDLLILLVVVPSLKSQTHNA